MSFAVQNNVQYLPSLTLEDNVFKCPRRTFLCSYLKSEFKTHTHTQDEVMISQPIWKPVMVWKVWCGKLKAPVHIHSALTLYLVSSSWTYDIYSIFRCIDSGFLNEGEGVVIILWICNEIIELVCAKIISDIIYYSKQMILHVLKQVWRVSLIKSTWVLTAKCTESNKINTLVMSPCKF